MALAAQENLAEMVSEEVQENLAETVPEEVQENLAETMSQEVPENTAEMASTLPRFIVFATGTGIADRGFLTYIRDGGEKDEYVKFLEPNAVSSYAKFEVEVSSNNPDFVHIRSYQNNKYLQRRNVPNEHWITATADTKEEDPSNPTCTLFRFFVYNSDRKDFKIMHVQSGRYLRIMLVSNSPFYECVYATASEESSDKFRILDWDSFMRLPRFVAFKGDNNQYIRVRPFDGGVPYLQFSASDIGDREVALEIFHTGEGLVRVKQLSSNKFWRRNSDWIRADKNDDGSAARDILFKPLHINDNTIGLFQVLNKRYAKRLTAEGKTNCLNTQLDYLTREAWLTVEEPITRREIKDVKYDLPIAKIYGERMVVAGQTSLINPTDLPALLSREIKIREKRTTTWRAYFSVKLTVEATARAGIPIIAEAKVRMSGEIETGIKWETTKEDTIENTDTVTVTVPPMSIARVEAVATEGTCDVPFTYIQQDTLYDGRIVETEHHGTFTGANYYNTQFKYTYEPLN